MADVLEAQLISCWVLVVGAETQNIDGFQAQPTGIDGFYSYKYGSHEKDLVL